MIATATAIALAAGIGAAGSVGAGAIGAHAAGKAADAQATAGMNAAQLQYKAAQDALGFNEGVFNANQSNAFPWVSSGRSALANLDWLLGSMPPDFNVNTKPMTAQGLGMPTMLGQPGAGMPGATQSPLVPGSNLLNARNPMDRGWKPGGGWKSGAPFGPGSDIYSRGPVNREFGNHILNGGGAMATGPSHPGKPGTPNQVPFSSLVDPSIGAKGSLLAPFVPPTQADMANDPGYMERLKLGQTALENSASARGGLLTGGTASDVNKFAQDYASNEYGNVFQRAFNTFETNQTNKYNRLAAQAGLGQQSVALLNSGNDSMANMISNLLMGSASGIGSNLQNAGAARASGYVGGANAWGGALGGLSNSALMYALLNGMGKHSPSSPGGDINYG